MNVCVVSFKMCWQNEAGQWCSYGGFPLQMEAVGTLFDSMTLVVGKGAPRVGGIPLPPHAKVVALPLPASSDLKRKIGVTLRLPYYLARIARHVWPADVVHLPLPGDIPLLGMAVGLLMNKRMLVRYGSSWDPTLQTTTMNRFTKACMRRFSGGRNVMLATGEGSAPADAGVEWIFSTALWKSELASIRPVLDRGAARAPRLVYIGRLSPEKGVDYLIEAVAALRDRGFEPLPVVSLIGDGPQRAELERLVLRRRCGDRIAFAGQLDRSQLGPALTDADICVQPSLTEGFSKAWLDAMAYGLPVLASQVGAARFVIGTSGERGWLVPPGDVEALANKLADVITHPPDWPAIRRACRAYAEHRTLEGWAARLGEFCARQWNMTLVEGKLRT